jgi:glycosyltransferase involved in cell wall biosynthesis
VIAAIPSHIFQNSAGSATAQTLKRHWQTSASLAELHLWLKQSGLETLIWGKKEMSNSVAVVVLGDVGRSPRMQYHCASFAQAGLQVSLVGFKGEKCVPSVENNPKITKFLMGQPFAGLPRSLFLLWAPLKVVFQVLQLFFLLAVWIPRPRAYLVQNPPSIPALLVVWLAARLRGAKFVIDWHNFGFTVLYLSMKGRHKWLINLASRYEVYFARKADGHLCVTNAMRIWLATHWKVNATVLYDKPPPAFRKATLLEKHDLFTRLASELDPRVATASGAAASSPLSSSSSPPPSTSSRRSPGSESSSSHSKQQHHRAGSSSPRRNSRASTASSLSSLTAASPRASAASGSEADIATSSSSSFVATTLVTEVVSATTSATLASSRSSPPASSISSSEKRSAAASQFNLKSPTSMSLPGASLLLGPASPALSLPGTPVVPSPPGSGAGARAGGAGEVAGHGAQSSSPSSSSPSSAALQGEARQLPSIPSSYELRDRPDRPAILISSTSWTEDEDFGILLDALVEMDKVISSTKEKKKYPDFLVLVTGKGPQKEFYLKKIAALSMKRVTIRTLWLTPTDYPLLLGSADLGVCLHTSTSGLDLPMKVVDMFGSGLPVCAVDFACLSELVKHDVNGLVFRNSEQLKDQLLALFEGFPSKNPSKQVLERLAKGVRQFQSERWQDNWDKRAKPLFVGPEDGKAERKASTLAAGVAGNEEGPDSAAVRSRIRASHHSPSGSGGSASGGGRKRR